MSQFNRYTATERVDVMRQFLGLSKRDFLKNAGFTPDDDKKRVGRLKGYKPEPIKALEEKVNAKSARCEATDTTIGERYQLARDFAGLTDAKVAQAMNRSRELVRRWGLNIHVPTELDALAQFLGVPLAWLEHGGEENLPADSHLGVRVGDEYKGYREQLYAIISNLYATEEINSGQDEDYQRAYIEWVVHNRPEVSRIARRAGGRWQVLNGMLVFSPWIPMAEHGLSRRHWSDEVEQIIQEELANQHSIYAAWAALERRCRALGYKPSEYPKKISLHKRIDTEKARAEIGRAHV